MSEWTLKRGVKLQRVKDLLRGKDKGLRGDSHTAAVALGLKPPQNLEVSSDAPADHTSALRLVKAAVRALEDAGVHIIGLIALLPRPVIAVRLSPAVEALGGTLVISIWIDGEVRRCYVAEYLGCLIRWMAVTSAPRVSLWDIPEGPGDEELPIGIPP